MIREKERKTERKGRLKGWKERKGKGGRSEEDQ